MGHTPPLPSAAPLPPPIRPRAPVRRRPPVTKRQVPPVRTPSTLPVRRELSAGGVAARYEAGVWLVALLQTEHKRGKVWVLPKGHVELHTGETIAHAAKREVQEEAGLKDLTVRDQLGVTRFRFQVETAVVAKTVHYFLMTTQQKQLVPQAEEGLLAAAWFPIGEAIERLAYDTDQQIVARARERLEPNSPRQRPSRPASTRKLRIHT